MHGKPFTEPRLSAGGLSRRQFVQLAAGGALAAGAGLSPTLTLGAANSAANGRADRPNVVLIITDQERYPQYWPPGWAEANLPNRKRLADHGLTFTHAFCNAAMCSPSRATLFTGLYLTQHGVEHTLTTGGSLSPEEPTLQTTTQNMARMLASAGYNVQYRGKWHMSKDVTSLTDASSADDLEKFGFLGWQPPDAGQDTNPAHFGGGCAGYDSRWAQQAADFLRSKEATSGRPFALIVSFINPHDTLAYARSWDAKVGSQQNGYCYNYLSQAPGCFAQGISLPPTLGEDLAHNYKPTAQAEALLLLNTGLGVLLDATGPLDISQQLNYVNFYACLHKVVDQDIGTVVDALEANPALYKETIVIRVSDHGEMGLSHGGLRQKLFNAYEETIRVPMVISNPDYFPRPVQTDALASLIDIMPTLATLADVPNRAAWTFKGRDLTPIIADAIEHPQHPTALVQDSILFVYDDDNPAAPNPQPFVKEPCHIRCIRDTRYKYAVYFDPCGQKPAQYELYDLLNDSQELHNLADPANTGYYNQTLVVQMQAKLEAKMAETGVTFTPSTPYCPPT
jgi:arylsulfatase A-like enzyme